MGGTGLGGMYGLRVGAGGFLVGMTGFLVGTAGLRGDGVAFFGGLVFGFDVVVVAVVVVACVGLGIAGKILL